MARETIILTRQEIAEQVDVADTIGAIEEAMGKFEAGEDYLPPKAIFEIPIGEPAWAACINRTWQLELMQQWCCHSVLYC